MKTWSFVIMRIRTISCKGRKWYFRVVRTKDTRRVKTFLRLGTIPQVLISSSFRTSRPVDSKHSPPMPWSPPFPRKAHRIEFTGNRRGRQYRRARSFSWFSFVESANALWKLKIFRAAVKRLLFRTILWAPLRSIQRTNWHLPVGHVFPSSAVQTSASLTSNDK